MDNPLLTNQQALPVFSQIEAQHVEPAIDQILSDNRQQLSALLQGQHDTWQLLMEPIDAMHDRLNQAWSPVSHMNSVVNNDELRDAYNACLPKLSAYWSELGQNKDLYQAFEAIAQGDEFQRLDEAQRKVISNAIRDFKLAGVALAEEQQTRYREIAEQLSRLSNTYEEHVMDASNAWSKLVKDQSLLAGMPDAALAVARDLAQHKDQSGWMLSLDFPCYIAVMSYAENRELRKELYEAFVTRASDQGPHAKELDNSTLMADILRLRHEQAQLLGFANYAELSLQTKMADSPEHALGFLRDLAQRSLAIAQREIVELREFASKELGLSELQAWDVSYASEKMRQHLFAFSEQEIKQYFPAQRAIDGLFAVVERLYGLQIEPVSDVETWHTDVQFYQIKDADQQLRGSFYLDLYARAKKRGGAWMDDCVARRKIGETIQSPVAFLTCNFTPPSGEQPALLSHDEVTTLFHEFGHGLHHMLTKVDYLDVSGINGVEWDAVELPSQFMENWCWEPEALALISGHVSTGESLPAELLQKMLAARNFQCGMQMMRQLELAVFDLRIHAEYDPHTGDQIYPILNQVRADYAVMPAPSFNRFAHGFSHIFGGGYAAGYYSYKWAEVLSSDAFSLFEEQGIFDQQTGQSFLNNILEKGGSRRALELFTAFRGREPNIDALLRHSGISNALHEADEVSHAI